MARLRMIWGLFAFSAMCIVFFVLFLSRSRSEAPAAVPLVSTESQIVSEVATRYAVPSDVPFVSVISDIGTLTKVNPAFYEGLRDGDWIVRYPNLIIVYRREEGKIVKVE